MSYVIDIVTPILYINDTRARALCQLILDTLLFATLPKLT